MVKPKYIVSPDVLRLADINIVRLKAGTQPRIDPAKVSNLFALSLQSISASETELRGWFMQLWGGDDRQFPKENALGIALQRAKEKFQRLNKRRGSEGVEFLSIAFELPSVKLVGAEVGSVVAQQREAEDRPNSPERQLQATMFDQEERCQRLIDLEGQLASMHQLYANQVSECDALKMIVERARDTTTKLRKERDVAQFKLLRATQKVHRERTRALEKQRAIKNLRAAAHRQKNNIEKKVGLVSDVSRKLKAASERIAQRDNEVRQRDQIIDAVAAQCSENPEIATKVGSAYSPQVRQMCIQLIADKVPLENVPHVIETVLSFAGKRLAEVPSERTVRRIAGPECLSLSQAHVAEALSSAGDLTLQTDETSKFGQQFLATAVRTSEGDTFVLGLNEMCNKSAQSTLDIFKEKLKDLERVSSCNGVAYNVLLKMKSTMSDRAATEVLFNRLLQSYKEEICPLVIENWNELSAHEQAGFTQVESFFCSLHLLANFADLMSDVLTTHEGCVAEPERLGSLHEHTGFKSNEPGVFRLIRTAAKCFGRRGSEFGLYSKWRLFLEGKEINLPAFAPFKGNRFNIVFYDAEVTYVSHDVLIEFLENFGENRLHKAVLADLKEPLFMSELKVLALIGKVVTSPLWRLLESEIHVLDMNLYFSRLLSWLDESAADPTDFLSGVSGPFDEHLRDDAVFRKLIAPHECDAGAVAIASLTLSALAGLVRRLCADQLPGGRYFAPDDALRQMTASVPLHNKTPEAVFGFLDHLMTRRPNASMIVNEALIMFCKNKTSAWLASKTPEQTEALVRSAQLDAKQLRAIYKERSRALKEAAIAKLVQKQLKHSHQLLHAAQMKEKLTAEIMADGLWQTINEVDSRLSFISGDRKKVLALRKQLRFREKVLRQPPPNRESKDFVGKRFEHRLVNFATGEEQWLAGTVIGIVPGQNELFNVAYDSDPDIIHKFRLKEDLESNNLRVF